MPEVYERFFELYKSGKPNLISFAKAQLDDMYRNSGEFYNVKSFLFLWYLTTFRAMLQNLTQSLTTTIPTLASTKYLGSLKNATKAFERAVVNLKDFEANKFADHDLQNLFNRAKLENVFDAKFAQEFMNRAKGPFASGFGRFVDKLGMGFAMTESINRKLAFLTYLEAFKDKLPAEELYRKAADFVEDTQFMFSRINRPPIARGKWGSLILTFRLFTLNYLNLIYHIAKLGGAGNIAYNIANFLFPMFLLGGLSALPEVKSLAEAVRKLTGYDLEVHLREWLKAPEMYLGLGDQSPLGQDLGTIAWKGVSTILGVDLSGSIGMGEVVPLERGASELIFGVPYDFIRRFETAYKYYTQGRVGRAVETVMPPIVRDYMIGRRWMREGVRMPSGRLIVKNPSPRDILLKKIGLNPVNIQKYLDVEFKLRDKIEERKRMVASFNERLARALAEGDEQDVEKILLEIEEHNAKATNPEDFIFVNMSAIENRLWQYEYGRRVPRLLLDYEERLREAYNLPEETIDISELE